MTRGGDGERQRTDGKEEDLARTDDVDDPVDVIKDVLEDVLDAFWCVCCACVGSVIEKDRERDEEEGRGGSPCGLGARLGVRAGVDDAVHVEIEVVVLDAVWVLLRDVNGLLDVARGLHVDDQRRERSRSQDKGVGRRCFTGKSGTREEEGERRGEKGEEGGKHAQRAGPRSRP